MTSSWRKSNEAINATDVSLSNTPKTVELKENSPSNPNFQLTKQTLSEEGHYDKLPMQNQHLAQGSSERAEKEYQEQIQALQLRIQELEDWGGNFSENQSSSKEKEYDLLAARNRQLETELQRLQSHQRNNQLALDRLDEYEETISQLQEEVDQYRSNKAKEQPMKNGDTNRLLLEERKRNDELAHLLEETRLQLQDQTRQAEEKITRMENDFKEEARQQAEDEEARLKEINIREMLERQLIDLHEAMQTLENEKIELQQQLQSRDRQIQSFQTSASTPGSPPTRDYSSSSRVSPDLENQIRQLNSFSEQFASLLPSDIHSSDNVPSRSLVDRFSDLFEQFSSYIGTFSIIHEEFESLKQIVHEKQDEIEKLRAHLELTTERLTRLQEKESLAEKNNSFESDEDELEEILGFEQRAPSRQSLLSITPGEKQQLIAQNELLTALLNEKERELTTIQQAEKTRNFELLQGNLQQLEAENEEKQLELNDIRNVLDEKLRENSSLKKEKMFFIEKLAQFERERQEQQAMIQLPTRQPSQERDKSPAKPSDQYETLRSEYDQLLEVSTRQHEETLMYYNEYTRIYSLYNELNQKYSQLQIEQQSVQTLIQQKTEAYLQCQNELNTYQNLLYHQKKKSEDIDALRATLSERENQVEQLTIKEKQWLSEQSQYELRVKHFEEKTLKFQSNERLFDQLQLDLKRITHERDFAFVEKKKLENGIDLQLKEREEVINKQTTEYQRLTNEKNELLQRFKESDQMLSSIAHLNDELQTKDLSINRLQTQISDYEEQFQTTNQTRVEKQLVKNILLSYFQTPVDKQSEVVPLISALVGFTQDEYQKAISAISNNQPASGWLTGWLGTTPSKVETPVYHPEKSFAELLIQYVDQQSPNTLPQGSSDRSPVSTTEQEQTPHSQPVRIEI